MTAAGGLMRVEVELDGRELAEADARTLAAVRVSERLGQPAQCELVLLDPAGPLGRDGPAAGAAMLVRVGGEPLFRGELTGATWRAGPAGDRELRLRGYDGLHQLRVRRSLRARLHTSCAELAADLLDGSALEVRAVEDGPALPRVLQLGESDLELLQTVASASGLQFAVRDGELVVMSGRGDPRHEPLELRLGDSLLEASVDLSGEAACRAVSVFGWDALRATPHGGRADHPRSGREVAAEVTPGRLGGDGELPIGNASAEDDRLAGTLAQAALDAAIEREVACEGVAAGDAGLRPGAAVAISGVAGAVDGRYVLTRVVHRISAVEGWQVEFSTVPPPPPPGRAPVLTLGRVSDVDDPEKLGRLRVELVAFDGVESEWMPVLLPAAGTGKGLVALPDTGDDVLVQLTGPTLAQGLVLGGLYGTRGLPDAEPSGGAVPRYAFLTKGGQKLSLDDGAGAIRIENGDGSYVELGPDRALLHAVTALRIEAPGQRVEIAGSAIDFQRA